MRPNRVRLACLSLFALTLTIAVGCVSPAVRFLNFITLQKNPFVLALVTETRAANESPLHILNPFGPYAPLQSAMSRDLQRTVALDLCFPLQLQPCLETGIYHAAVVSPIQYARLSQPERFPVLATPVDENGQTARSALLIVPIDSQIQAVGDLCGKAVAFGPASDSRTHYAALQLLASHGLRKSDLALELLPIPGSLRHFAGAREVVASVANGSSAAGFVDEGEWQQLPESCSEESDIGRDSLRILARTVALPDSLIIGAPKLDAQTLERTRAFLASVGDNNPDALLPLHVQRYELPSDELLAACRELAASEPTCAEPASDESPEDRPAALNE